MCINDTIIKENKQQCLNVENAFMMFVITCFVSVQLYAQ